MPRRPKKILSRLEAMLHHPELADRERLVLQAYLHFEPEHGGACGKPGVCWPTDAELGTFLGRSDITIRRARRALAAPGKVGVNPWIAVQYIAPFGTLPSGEKTWHGVNVITLLEVARPEAAGVTIELREASDEVARLERELARARRKQAAAVAKASVERAIAESEAANDGGGSHNAPCVITPGWSIRPGLARGRGGERTPAIRRAG